MLENIILVAAMRTDEPCQLLSSLDVSQYSQWLKLWESSCLAYCLHLHPYCAKPSGSPMVGSTPCLPGGRGQHRDLHHMPYACDLVAQ